MRHTITLNPGLSLQIIMIVIKITIINNDNT